MLVQPIYQFLICKKMEASHSFRFPKIGTHSAHFQIFLLKQQNIPTSLGPQAQK